MSKTTEDLKKELQKTTTDVKKEVQKSLELVRTLGAEIKVKVQSAGVDTKEERRKLEPQLAHIEKAAADFTVATRKAVTETVKKLSKLRSSL
jgi:hypothetical protein